MFTAKTEAVGTGYRYVILDEVGDALLTSGAFALEADARRVGDHFAADPDLLHYIKDKS